MSDLPTPDEAGQPCTGENGGHAPFERDGRTWLRLYWADVPGFPDLQLVMMHAAERFPCLGQYVRNAGTGYETVDLLHLDMVGIHFADPPDANLGVLIAARRNRDGHVAAVETDKLRRLPLTQRRRIRAGWDAAYKDLARLVGRPAVSLEQHITKLRANYFRLKPLCAHLGHSTAQHPTHSECLEGTGITFNTSRERLRLAGWSWTKLRRLWERIEQEHHDQSGVPNNS